MLTSDTTYRPGQKSAGWTLVNWARIYDTKPKLLMIFFGRAWILIVMSMVKVFSALFGRECDMVGRVHDSSIEDGCLLASWLILTSLCAADALKWRKQQPILCVGTRVAMLVQLVLDWSLIACGEMDRGIDREGCQFDTWIADQISGWCHDTSKFSSCRRM